MCTVARFARLTRPIPTRLSDDARRRCERDDLAWRDDEIEPRPSRHDREEHAPGLAAGRSPPPTDACNCFPHR